ncbi:MAG: HNH endonuclease [Candidatus Krumholzibacteria bacterium]|nr:HNH endonuclease [Candidatus Krumholzibacteria bacterium]MDH4337091.1 HNH endonuclease [Candidatus Krumholzibacteria bacterium]MDH5268628.1 HNH endonuclease [Candidatus Krumholzibacteria bacterium]MDH5627690.1 HNH endonuclease [Candidatus Krumholzibacteria bacterium]
MSLHTLSDREILSRTLDISRRERRLTLRVLLHLIEVERRRLHLKQGYSSLFDYCRSALKYSESSAVRRVRAARCVRRFPEVFTLLEANEISVCALSRIARVLSVSNSHALLERVRGRSLREIDAIVAEYAPRPKPREIVQPVVVPVRRPVAATTSPVVTAAAAADTADACEKRAYRHSGGKNVTTSVEPDERPAVLTEKRMLMRFSGSEAFMAKLAKVRSLAWHRLSPDASLEEVFELALDAFIEANDPVRRRERRVQARASASHEKRAGTQQLDVHTRRSGDNARRLPVAVRDEVFVRDKNRCTFVGANGRRCGSTRALQVDHIVPVARGGPGTADNLRLLCAYHNRLEAERLLGAATMDRFRQSACRWGGSES